MQGSNPRPSPPEPKTHKNAVSMPVKLLPDFCGSRLDLIGFKIKKKKKLFTLNGRHIFLPFRHEARARRTAYKYFALASKGLSMKGFATFMNCCLRTSWIISDSVIECQWGDVLCQTPHVAMVINGYHVGFRICQHIWKKYLTEGELNMLFCHSLSPNTE